MKRLLLGVLPLMLASAAVFGQNCTFCAETLRHGTTDVFYSEKRASLDESVNLLYSKDLTFWENYSRSQNHSTELDAAYSVYSVSFSSISNEDERKSTFNREKTSFQYSKTLSQAQYQSISQVLVDKAPYDAFVQCVKAGCDLGITIDASQTGDLIIIYITYKSLGSPNQKTVLKATPSVANAVPIDNHFVRGMTLSSPNSVSAVYRRLNPKQDVVFSCSFDNYPTSPLTIKPAVTGNALVPVGTIVASVLDYGSFCAINEIPRGNDLSDQIWVPADGRTVAGSVYAKVRSNVPDLRGTFLRGLNVFDPNINPAYMHPEQKDAADARNAGDFEGQDLQPHTHAVNDPGHRHPIQLKDAGRGGIGGSGADGLNLVYPPDHATEPAKTGISVLASDGKETRPGNVSVYYYIKIN